MSLNFNVSPYFDDFDPTKNFHRILFQPGYAVQARELTQSQSILQDQISKFADNIFKQNTPIKGGQVTTNLNCYYIKLNFQYSGLNITASDFLNKTIQDSTGTILAKVIATTEGINSGDAPTLYVNYYSGLRFTDNMVITPTDGTNLFATTIGATNGSTCTGFSSTASIAEGVFYVVNGYSLSSTQNEDGTYSKYSIGNFVSVQPKTIVLSKYSNAPSLRVGLQINETIVDYIGDASLLDPAIGASNYQAPGADRYQITLELITTTLAPGNDDKFIELLRIENGKIIKQVTGTVYSTIDDYFSKRDYETNGNYIVNDFKLNVFPYYGNSNYYKLNVGKGLAYVSGYRVENQSEITLVNERARDTNSVINNDIYIDYGNYFYVNNVRGLFDVTTFKTVNLHSVSSADIDLTNANTYNSTLVGTGIIRNLSYEFDSGTSNTSSYVYKAYVSDIITNSLTANAAVSGSTSNTIKFDNTNNQFSTSSNNAYYGVTIVVLDGTNKGDTRKIISYNASTQTATVDPAFTLTPDSTTQFSLLFTTEVIESVTTSTAGTPYVINASANINASLGKVAGLPTGDTILNNSSDPELIFPIGASYVASLNNTTYRTSKVFRNKTFGALGGSSSITIQMPSGSGLTFSGSGVLSTDAVKQQFVVIDRSTKQILPINTASGNTVTIVSGTSATFLSDGYTGKVVDIIVNNVAVDNGDTTNYVLKSKNLVSGNTASVTLTAGTLVTSSTYLDTTKGQAYILQAGFNPTKQLLYVSDVKSIVKIINTRDPGIPAVVDMLSSPIHDVTNLFDFNNGQKDSYYDYAYISLKPGANAPKGNILVVFDYYSHTGGDGYFSGRSYKSVADGGVSTSPENYAQIPSYTSKKGKTYKLSDSIDFRPTRKNLQTSLVFDYTGNPAADDTGILIPNDLSNFISDYSYYLGRKDKLVLTKDRSFQILKGSPAINPVFPVEPDGSLVVAELIHDPYTAYIPGEGPTDQISNLSVNKIQSKRWTMADITDLETRVENIEYYTALNLLEQKASSLQVPDVNGLNRFKNGILVDDFSDYSTADTANPDFIANINIRKQQLTPLTSVENFQLQNPVVLDSLGTVTNTNNYNISSINGKQTNIFTLPYTKSSIINQPLASSVLSINPFAVTNQQGILNLNPPMDNWIDESQTPSVLTNGQSYQIYQATTNGLNVVNVGDFASITGTPLLSSSAVNKSSRSSSLAINNGYVINNSVLPYIRPQQIFIRAKGLLVNTPISTWFDGQNVNQYITTPNTIELQSVLKTNNFTEDDVVGFYYDNTFHPIGTVVSVYTYPSDDTSTTTKVRLYVSNIQGYIYAPVGVNLQNAQFDSSGNYSSTTANGVVVGTKVLDQHRSGTLSGVGGHYIISGITGFAQVYKVMDPNKWGTFLNQYGVWSDLTHDSVGNSTNSYDTTTRPFSVNFPSTGTYTFLSSSSGTATTKLDTTTIITGTNATSVTTYTQSVTAGSHNISWIALNSSGPAGYALVIKDPNGNIIFDSTNPAGATYDYVGKDYALDGGGYWFTGVQKVKLDPNASNVDNFYTGGKINITSTYVLTQTTQTANYVPSSPIWGSVTRSRVVTTNVPYTYLDFIGGGKTQTADPAFAPYFAENIYKQGFTVAQAQALDTNLRALSTAERLNIVTTIGNIYRNYLGRLPETSGLAWWTVLVVIGIHPLSGMVPVILAAAQNNNETIYSAGNAPSVRKGQAVLGDFFDKPDATIQTVQSYDESVIVGYT